MTQDTTDTTQPEIDQKTKDNDNDGKTDCNDPNCRRDPLVRQRCHNRRNNRDRRNDRNRRNEGN